MAKGLFSSDFMVGLALFIIILLLVGPMWNSLRVQTANAEYIRALQTASLEVSDTLVRTQGSPLGWNSSWVRSIGLSQEQRVLNATKAKYFYEFLATNYTEAKFMLGAGRYEMQVVIANSTGFAAIYEGVRFTHNAIPANASDIATTRRVAILQYNDSYSEFVSVSISVWNG